MNNPASDVESYILTNAGFQWILASSLTFKLNFISSWMYNTTELLQVTPYLLVPTDFIMCVKSWYLKEQSNQA